jgi:hypothetical protein
MSFIFDFDPTNDMLRCRLNGPVNNGAFEEFFRTGAKYAVRTHPSVGIVDFSEVTTFDVSANTIQQLAKSPPVLRDPNLRRVVIAPSPEVFGMMRMFEVHGEEERPNLHVVHSEREAWAILAVQNPKFEPLKND